MPRDLRVKALVRMPLRQHSSSGGSGVSECSASAVSSDEEWVSSSAEVSSITSSVKLKSKQGRSEELDHPQSVQDDEHDDMQLEVNAPRLKRSKFESWGDLDAYLVEYMKETYQTNACVQVEDEYEPAPDVYLQQHDCDDEDALDEPNSEYSITKRDWSCSCLFMSSRLLPCQHVLFLRKALGRENIIPTKLLNPRWLLALLRMNTEFPDFCGESFAVSRVMQEPNIVWDSNRKFREANSVASTINEHLSRLGMKEYKTAMKALREVATLLKHDVEVSPANVDVDSTGDEVDMTQVGIELDTPLGSGSPHLSCGTPQLGSGTDQLDCGTDQFGCGTPQLGSGTNRIGMSGDRLATHADQVHETTQVGTPLVANAAQGRFVNLEDFSDSFDIESPPKPRGRQKQKPKAVKAKRNLAITMVQEDLDTHENQLNLLALYEILDGAPTYNSSHEKLTHFSLFKFLTKPKSPIAYEIAQLPATKPLMRPEEICRVFSMDLIKKCMAKVSAYQKKRAGVRELDIAFEIVGLGVFANSTIALMKNWHRAHEKVKQIDSTLNWLKQLDFSRLNASTYSEEDDPELPEKLKVIPLLSIQPQVLDFTAKECLSYGTMHLSFQSGSATIPT